MMSSGLTRLARPFSMVGLPREVIMVSSRFSRLPVLGLGLALGLALFPLKAHADWRWHGGFRGPGFGVFVGGWPGYYPYYTPYYYPPPYYYPYYAPAFYQPPPAPPAYR